MAINAKGEIIDDVTGLPVSDISNQDGGSPFGQIKPADVSFDGIVGIEARVGRQGSAFLDLSSGTHEAIGGAAVGIDGALNHDGSDMVISDQTSPVDGGALNFDDSGSSEFDPSNLFDAGDTIINADGESHQDGNLDGNAVLFDQSNLVVDGEGSTEFDPSNLVDAGDTIINADGESNLDGNAVLFDQSNLVVDGEGSTEFDPSNLVDAGDTIINADGSSDQNALTLLIASLSDATVLEDVFSVDGSTDQTPIASDLEASVLENLDSGSLVSLEGSSDQASSNAVTDVMLAGGESDASISMVDSDSSIIEGSADLTGTDDLSGLSLVDALTDPTAYMLTGTADISFGEVGTDTGAISDEVAPAPAGDDVHLADDSSTIVFATTAELDLAA